DQLDPARQRLQLGAELIGADSVAAASEVVSVAIDALRAAGVTNISIDFTLPDLVDTLAATSLPLDADKRAAVRRELDTKDAGGLREAGGEAYLPLLYATGLFDEAIDKLSALDVGGALASRIEGLRAIATTIGDRARVTLDPTERHGFEYQSWFGFTLYGEGARGALGRGGTYTIKGSNESATGFSLYMDPLLDALGGPEADTRDRLFLPLGHDRDVAARLRAIGWRTVAAVSDGDDAAALGCSHRLDGAEPRPL
ncbi:MAG: ATP phosphoribosyltransferase regulatory subunit, partial [Pseudomonadota bacterium]|nr:ATP phosphoribosyltransferase regulatory subunit [Pseudomonadota bacterium]